MPCEDQLILLAIFKGEVANYTLAVNALSAARTLSLNEFSSRFDGAKEAFAGALAVRRSLLDHMHTHGCTLEPETLAIAR
jgi:hypothetical protein